MTSVLPSSAPSDLRPYQRAAVEAVLAARRAGKRRLLVHLPTGAGKTVIFSHLARLARRQVLVLAHREELLTQARDKLQRALGGAAGAPWWPSSAARCARRLTPACWSARSARCTRSAWRRCCAGGTWD